MASENSLYECFLLHLYGIKYFEFSIFSSVDCQKVERSLSSNKYHFIHPFYCVEINTDSGQTRELAEIVKTQEIFYSKTRDINYWPLEYYFDVCSLTTIYKLSVGTKNKNDINLSSLKSMPYLTLVPNVTITSLLE